MTRDDSMSDNNDDDMSEGLALPEAGPPSAREVKIFTGGKVVGHVGGKLKRVLDRMVWEGIPWAEAAKAENMTARGVRQALEKPHVRRYVTLQRSAFRAALSTRNETVAANIRDKEDGNQMARLGALKYLDGLDEDENTRRPAGSVTPGVVVQINLNRQHEVDDTLIEVSPKAPADHAARTE